GGQAIAPPAAVQVSLAGPIADGLPGAVQLPSEPVRVPPALADQADGFRPELGRVRWSSIRHVDSSPAGPLSPLLRCPRKRGNSSLPSPGGLALTVKSPRACCHWSSRKISDHALVAKQTHPP